jgi:hypothetical protein
MLVKFLHITLISLFVLNAKAQPRLEVTSTIRADEHGDYTTRYFSRSFTNDMTLKGISQGITVQYIQPVVKNIYCSFGVGYYRLAIQKIKSVGRFGPTESRTIDYHHPNGIQPLFNTKQYAYNNMDLTTGIMFQSREKNGRAISLGSNVHYYQTFSQKYHINWGNGIKHKTRDWRTLGYGVEAHLGLLQRLKYKPFYLHPKLIIPIYQQIRGDEIFGEPESMLIGNWLSGIGLSFTVGKF